MNQSLPETSLLSLSPTQAQALLGTSAPVEKGRQRGLSKSRVAQYAKDMMIGRWQATPTAGIAIGVDGLVIDGRHRLHAIVKSGKTVLIYVTKNVPFENFSVIDIGMGRTPHQIAKIAGSALSSSELSACIQALVLPHLAQGIREALKNPEDLDAVAEFFSGGVKMAFEKFPGSSFFMLQGFRGAFVRAYCAYPEKTQQLRDLFVCAVTGEKDSSILSNVPLHLNSHLVQLDGKQKGGHELYSYTLKAISLYLKGGKYATRAQFNAAIEKKIINTGDFYLSVDAKTQNETFECFFRRASQSQQS
jgi:hypothetical protein